MKKDQKNVIKSNNKAGVKKPVYKKILKIMGIVLGILIVIASFIYFFVLQFPSLNDNPTVGKWYRVTNSEMKDSEGGGYHAFLKKGSENKVMVYFAGGGVVTNEQMARNDTANTRLVSPDALANFTMNMGGIATGVEGNPFKDWTVILFPYATGDFHAGTGEYKYTDKDGKEKTWHFNGYTNFKVAMQEITSKAGISEAESVLVTGYSAGGWGASLLADDVFTDYFPDAKNKTVLVDSSTTSSKDWKDVAKNVWKAPKHIVDRIETDDIMLDSLTALNQHYGKNVKILFNSSTRDGDLAKVQRYFNNFEIDEKTGEMPLEESDGDAFQEHLKALIPKLQEQANAHVFIYDGLKYYDDPRNFTMHTIIATPYVYQKLNDTNKSIEEWLNDAINGDAKNYGIGLLDKKY